MDAPAAMAVAIADTPEALPPMTIAMADSVRTAYRSALKQAFAAGEAQPLVVPYSMLGAFIVPTLWLAVPHVHRPWLYRTRWLVMLFVVVFDVRLILRTSSTNMAFSYAAGLMSAWAIVSNANLLLWMRPQFDSARILRRPVPAAQTGKIVSPNGTLKGTTENNTNGVATEHGLTQRKQIKTEQTSVGEYRQQSEFVWEPFPAEASFAYRLNWAIDLACSFRGAGMPPYQSFNGHYARTYSSQSSQAGPTPYHPSPGPRSQVRSVPVLPSTSRPCAWSQPTAIDAGSPRRSLPRPAYALLSSPISPWTALPS